MSNFALPVHGAAGGGSGAGRTVSVPRRKSLEPMKQRYTARPAASVTEPVLVAFPRTPNLRDPMRNSPARVFRLTTRSLTLPSMRAGAFTRQVDCAIVTAIVGIVADRAGTGPATTAVPRTRIESVTVRRIPGGL